MGSITPDIVDRFIQLSGPLFRAVQQAGVFDDSKTFVDCIPSTPPDKIRREFSNHKNDPAFDLEAFVRNHFNLFNKHKAGSIASKASMFEHIDQLWNQLSRQPDQKIDKHSTLIPLPYPYIVPGGRFREIYYWDTYFTSVGLAAAGHLDMVENLTRNFASLIQQIGHIPNGNRYYYVSRSQPPFLVLLIDLIAQHKGEKAVHQYLPALQQEYSFWMDGKSNLAKGEAHRRTVNVNGTILNRYWDDRPLPREESWREDVELAKALSPQEAEQHYRNLRAGAESGWDFSSRWFADQQSLNTIQTTDILPVDLNALLYLMEKKLGHWTEGNDNLYTRAAQKRKKSFNTLFWNATVGYYFDYRWKQKEQTETWSMAGTYPLFAGLASGKQANLVANVLRSKFLQEGGLVSTLHGTGQQWDWPNGWAPLQWIAVRGLQNYGHDELAKTIAERWLALNESVFKHSGKMMEKYNVCDLSLEAGGGEYPLQDGFGWTNGVAVALKKLFYNR
jgi:alpha,alpha-trehalase